MRLFYKARTKSDRDLIKNKAAKVLTAPQQESLAKKYAAYAIQIYKDGGGSKAYGNKKTDLITLRCKVSFGNFQYSTYYKEMPLHDKGDLYLSKEDKEAIAKKTKSILTAKKYKVDVVSNEDLKLHTIKK